MADRRDPREIVHDARSALSVIQLTTEGLVANEAASEERAALEAILKQINRLAQLLDELAQSRN